MSQTKWLWVRIPLQSLKIHYLFFSIGINNEKQKKIDFCFGFRCKKRMDGKIQGFGLRIVFRFSFFVEMKSERQNLKSNVNIH